MLAITEQDRLFTRLLIAVQSETGLERVSVEGLAQLLDTARDRDPDAIGGALPTTLNELKQVVAKLHAVGWIEFDDSNPHVNVAFEGLLLCGPLQLPGSVIDALPDMFIRDDLA